MSIINLKRFEDKYKYLLGEKFSDFHDALQLPPLKYFRVNSVRNIDYLKELDVKGIGYLSDPYFNDFYKLTDDVPVSDTISFLTGGVYIQNPSSIIPVDMLSRALNDKEEPVVLDMCAAPGGKTTGLSEKIDRRGLIVANEVSKSRLKSLHFNLEKYGAWNVKTTSVDGRVVGKMLPETFDGILLDAPCSNENKIYRNPEVSRNWSEDLVRKMQKLQTELIVSAYEALKPGGIMVYSTCTFSVEENEGVIRSLL
ncbi:MAG: RsmB/NOP family class I SAM-dependent RNA methyltransferase, partial [Flexistipes sinusarabici]